MEARGHTDRPMVRCTWSKGRKTDRTIKYLVPSAVSLMMIVSSGKANEKRNRERAVFDLFSTLKWVRSKGFW